MGKHVCFLFQSGQFQFPHAGLTNFLPAKNVFNPETSVGLCKGASRVLSTCLYCNLSLSHVVLEMCREDQHCARSFYSFIIAQGELSLCQTHLNIFILLSIYVYSYVHQRFLRARDVRPKSLQ